MSVLPKCMECNDEGSDWPCPSCGRERLCKHDWVGDDDCAYCAAEDARAEAIALRSECADKAIELERLRLIEATARELITEGMSLRFTSGPALSVIEKPDRSDAHYRLCKLLETP